MAVEHRVSVCLKHQSSRLKETCCEALYHSWCFFNIFSEVSSQLFKLYVSLSILSLHTPPPPTHLHHPTHTHTHRREAQVFGIGRIARTWHTSQKAEQLFVKWRAAKFLHPVFISSVSQWMYCVSVGWNAVHMLSIHVILFVFGKTVDTIVGVVIFYPISKFQSKEKIQISEPLLFIFDHLNYIAAHYSF